MTDDAESTLSARLPRSAEERMLSFRRVLAALMHSEVVERGDVATALGHLTEISAEVLQVERASIWRLSPDKQQMTCADLFERFTNRHLSGAVLHAADKPRYFAALLEARCVPAHDAQADERTSEFTETYLGPLGITSMLDVPILLDGDLVGVVCHEHVGPARVWQPWEELVASSLGDFVSMILGAAQLKEQITEIKKSHRELERREADISNRKADGLRTTLELVPAPIIVARAADAVPITLNRRAKSLLKHYDAGLSGKEIGDIFWNDADRERMVAKFKAGNTLDRFESELRRSDATSTWATVTAQTADFEGEKAIVMVLSEIAEQKKLEARITELESKDVLTGALLRAQFLDAAQEEIERASHSGFPLCLAIVDADRLKQLNGMFGLAAGDDALRLVSDVLFENTRESDTIGRYAGAQLIAVLPECPLDQAKTAMEATRARIEAEPPEHDGEKMPLTVSIGVVERAADEPLADMLKRCDEAVRSARGAGGNRVAVGATP